MTIAALVLAPAHCIDIGSSVMDAALHMLREDLDHLPVSENGRYVGMLDMGDVMNAIVPAAARGPGALTHLGFAGDMRGLIGDHVANLDRVGIATVADRQIPALAPNCPIPEALLLLSHHDRPLAVADVTGCVIGMLTARLLLTHLLRE